ncbi:hypothetical protein Golax_000578, partial [Gossypium laxum]|nr:hypothetical protein [Gossypium laxum]
IQAPVGHRPPHRPSASGDGTAIYGGRKRGKRPFRLSRPFQAQIWAQNSQNPAEYAKKSQKPFGFRPPILEGGSLNRFSAVSESKARYEDRVEIRRAWLRCKDFSLKTLGGVRFTTEGANRGSYQRFMNELYDALTERADKSEVIPVLPSPLSELDDHRQYVLAELSNEYQSIRLALNVNDMYILGCHPGDSDTSYFFKGVEEDVVAPSETATTKNSGVKQSHTDSGGSKPQFN